jgi:hypothetical protein
MFDSWHPPSPKWELPRRASLQFPMLFLSQYITSFQRKFRTVLCYFKNYVKIRPWIIANFFSLALLSLLARISAIRQQQGTGQQGEGRGWGREAPTQPCSTLDKDDIRKLCWSRTFPHHFTEQKLHAHDST